MPKIPSKDQRQFCVECYAGMLGMRETNASFLNNVVTCDESWVFTYDPESKYQSAQWKYGTSPGPTRQG